MPRIDFFAARSPGGEGMLRRWGAGAEIGIVPHTIPEWALPERPEAEDEPFTIGFAGRLIEAKGIRDLLAAVRRRDFLFRLLVVGDGPLRGEIEATDLGVACRATQGRAEPRDALALCADGSPRSAFSDDRAWAEQFGKVLCEALLCGIP